MEESVAAIGGISRKNLILPSLQPGAPSIPRLLRNGWESTKLNHLFPIPCPYETVVSSPRFNADAMMVFNMVKTCEAAW
jgi:hypothetical protein